MFGAELRTNKYNPHTCMTPNRTWWETSALTTAPTQPFQDAEWSKNMRSTCSLMTSGQKFLQGTNRRTLPKRIAFSSARRGNTSDDVSRRRRRKKRVFWGYTAATETMTSPRLHLPLPDLVPLVLLVHRVHRVRRVRPVPRLQGCLDRVCV